MSGVDVAIDARETRRMSVGTRAYLRELLRALPYVAPDVCVARVGSGENFGWSEQVALPRALGRLRPRLVHYPTTFAPLVRRAPYVVTVHDLIHLKLRTLFAPAAGLHYAAVGIPLARRARLLFVGDERTVADCERYLGVAPSRCRVVPLGYDPAVLTAPADLPGAARPFVLYAGNHRPHKNLATLYRAWAALPPAIALDLRITGADDAAARGRYVRVNGALIFTGDLAAADLYRHYRAALAYVHPAFAEGFGIPMLEAAVAGTPVIASDSAVPRIVQPYAQTFPAANDRVLTALLEALVVDPEPFRRRAAEGAVPLRAYTWDRFAAATAAVYREVMAC